MRYTNHITVLSLGAGVQSTTLLLMAEKGLIEPPLEAIFADTGWEPQHVYTHLEWLRTQTSIPITRVSSGDLREDFVKGILKASIPVHTFTEKGTKTIMRRYCTSSYKLVPIRRRVRELKELHNAKTVTQQIGISTDERLRVKPSDAKYVINNYPLIEHNMSRDDCLLWLEENNYPVPKRSACIGCPFRNNASWLEIKNDPDSWADAVEVDEAVRNPTHYHSQFFLHADRIPLRLVDFEGKAAKNGVDDAGSFLGECEGMCGV